MKIRSLLFVVTFLFISENCKSQELSMFPGFFKMQFYQDDVQVSKNEFVNLVMKDKESGELWRKSKKHITYAWVAFGAQLGFLIWQNNRRDNRESQIAPLVGNIGSGIVAIGFAISSGNLKKRSILKYNKNKDIGSIDFGPTYNGMGLVLSF